MKTYNGNRSERRSRTANYMPATARPTAEQVRAAILYGTVEDAVEMAALLHEWDHFDAQKKANLDAIRNVRTAPAVDDDDDAGGYRQDFPDGSVPWIDTAEPREPALYDEEGNDRS